MANFKTTIEKNNNKRVLALTLGSPYNAAKREFNEYVKWYSSSYQRLDTEIILRLQNVETGEIETMITLGIETLEEINRMNEELANTINPKTTIR